jgi:hypothetical protein
MGDVTPSGTYATSGTSFQPGWVGMGKVEKVMTLLTAFKLKYESSTGKMRLYTHAYTSGLGGGQHSAAEAVSEVANAAAVGGVGSIPCIFLGQ